MEKPNKDFFEKSLNMVTKNIFIYILIVISAGLTGYIGVPTTSRIMHALTFGVEMVLVYSLLFLISLLVIFISFYFSKAISWKGTIHRLEYFVIVFTINSMYKLCSLLYAPEEFKLSFTPNQIMIHAGILLLIFFMYIEVCATIKRLNDIKWSKWLTIIAMIPYVCIFIKLPCFFIKGKESQESIKREENN